MKKIIYKKFLTCTQTETLNSFGNLTLMIKNWQKRLIFFRFHVQIFVNTGILLHTQDVQLLLI